MKICWRLTLIFQRFVYESLFLDVNTCLRGHVLTQIQTQKEFNLKFGSFFSSNVIYDKYKSGLLSEKNKNEY